MSNTADNVYLQAVESCRRQAAKIDFKSYLYTPSGLDYYAELQRLSLRLHL